MQEKYLLIRSTELSMGLTKLVYEFESLESLMTFYRTGDEVAKKISVVSIPE